MYGIKNYDLHIHGPSPDKVLVLKSLVCNSTLAGGSQTDQISLRVDNKTVGNSPFPMNAGDDHPFPSSFEEAFHQTVTVELFAEEMKLGSQFIMDESGTSQLSFDRVHPANYILTYEVQNK